MTYVKQLSIQYDLNKKNSEKVRGMFAITQWLNKQGFRLATHMGMVLNRDGNIMYGER